MAGKSAETDTDWVGAGIRNVFWETSTRLSRLPGWLLSARLVMYAEGAWQNHVVPSPY
jgi:hypothetical protein